MEVTSEVMNAYYASKFIAEQIIKELNKKIKKVRNTSNYADILDMDKKFSQGKVTFEIDLVQPTSRNNLTSKSADICVSYDPKKEAYKIDINVKSYILKEAVNVVNTEDEKIEGILGS